MTTEFRVTIFDDFWLLTKAKIYDIICEVTFHTAVLKTMFNWLSKVAFVGTFAGMFILAASLYNNGFKTVEDIQKKYSELTNVTSELLTDAKIMRQPTYDLNIADIKNKISLSSQLKVANLSSEQVINVYQTGTRDTWVIGGLLKGSANFTFKATFTGSVEYNTKEIVFEQKGKTIVVTLGVPKILFNDIKYTELNTSGNLNDMLVAKSRLLSTLDSKAKSYNYSLYLNAPETKPLMTTAAKQASDSLKDMITKIINVTKPNVEYEVIVNGANNGVDTVTIQNGNNSVIVPLASILTAVPDPILDHLINGSDTKAQLNVKKVDNLTKPPN